MEIQRMVFKSIIRAAIFNILLLGINSNGWGYSEEDRCLERIHRRNAPRVNRIGYEEAKHENSYNQRPISTLRFVISAINCLAPAIIVFWSAYIAYLNGTEEKS